jgi:toxin FitB
MSWLLDTSTLSALRRPERATPRLHDWFAGVAEDDLFTSVLVVGEIRRGVELIRRRDEASALAIGYWLGGLIDRFSDRILPIDLEVAERWAELNVPDPVPVVDGLLAATALVRDLTVVTLNRRDFERTGVRLLDPTAAA